MVFSNREKVIAGCVGAGLALLLGYYQGLVPYLETKDRLNSDLQKAQNQLFVEDRLTRSEEAARDQWKSLVAAGLKNDLSAGQSQVVDSMQAWARKARCKMDFRSEKLPRVGDFLPIRVTWKGEATSAGFGSLLYQIEEAATKRNYPIRITDINVAPVKEGTDDLLFTLDVQTVVYSPMPVTTRNKPK